MPHNLKAQIFTVTSGTEMSIMPGTIFFADSLSIIPTDKFTLTGTALFRNSAISNPTATNTIAKFYHFSVTTSPFSGELSMRYSNGSQLNGISEGNLNVFANDGSLWQYLSETKVDSAIKMATNTHLSLLSLNEITLGSYPQHLNVSVYLEGFYNTVTGTMNSIINYLSLVPKSQPYNVAPWYYSGTETVSSFPEGVIDWVLVELRQAAFPSGAITTLPGWPRACMVKSDGSIVDVNNKSLDLLCNPSQADQLYVVIRHRNHVAIMSSTGLTISGNNYVYNFKDAITKAYGGSAGYRQLSNTVFGMVGADADSDGSISVLDFSKWATDFGKTNGYLNSDVDEDGQISVLDFSKWATNFGIGNISPLKSQNINEIENLKVKYKSQVP